MDSRKERKGTSGAWTAAAESRPGRSFLRPSQRPRRVARAVVDVQRAAAALAGLDLGLAAVLAQHADRGAVDVGKQVIGQAAREEGDPALRLAPGGEDVDSARRVEVGTDGVAEGAERDVGGLDGGR